MRVYSFIEERNRLIPVEVEVALWPGLPTIQFLGRADAHLKESASRIKSAIKASGFQFPTSQQIVVNLRPTHWPKSSQGIELAVAAAYLWMSGQLPEAPKVEKLFVYGELTLFGDVIAPKDLRLLNSEEECQVLTGKPAEAGLFSFPRWVIGNLRSLGEPMWEPGEDSGARWERPALGELMFDPGEARLLQLLALGGYHVLFAGPAGSGKSTLARVLHALMAVPTPEEDREIQRLNPGATWRPFVEPHHSTPRMAMIGGGAKPLPGEIARAHRGLLLLDELLEFDRLVLESLREPFERSYLRIGRLGGVEHFPVSAQIVGTTNLCPCGDYLPGDVYRKRCRYSLVRCRSYQQRLSGPLLDRFHLLVLAGRPRSRTLSFDSVLSVVEEARARRKINLASLYREATEKELMAVSDATVQSVGISSQVLSQRRILATLRVAKGLADLNGKERITMEEIDEAMKWTLHSFHRLELWD